MMTPDSYGLSLEDWEADAEQYESYVTELQVMQSAAGYYVGRGLVSVECSAPGMPYSRESGYFSSSDAAADHLAAMTQ